MLGNLEGVYGMCVREHWGTQLRPLVTRLEAVNLNGPAELPQMALEIQMEDEVYGQMNTALPEACIVPLTSLSADLNYRFYI